MSPYYHRKPNMIFRYVILISVLASCLIFLTHRIVNTEYRKYFLYKTTYSINKNSDDKLYCYHITEERSLPDISDYPPSFYKKNIFFLETSCSSYNKGKLFIKARQACAVESAARLNPNMDVHLLFASPGLIANEDSESDRILTMLSNIPNVKLLHFDISRYTKNSPVDILWTSGKIKTSVYPLAHASDILRLLTLWKFGGIYLDLDVIVIKSLEYFPENFAGAESDEIIANGVMGFSKIGKGHDYVTECLNDVSEHFDGKQWSYNGPRLITRNILGHCNQFDHQSLVRFGRCEEFRIFPPSAFYLIPYQEWKWFFNENLTDVIIESVEEQSYMVHVWNKFSFDTNISKENVNVPYLSLASKYCPRVVQELHEYF